jgi:streptomycin 6-kinase
MTSPEAVRTDLHAWLNARASSLGVDERSLTVDYVLNWGGFVNASFHITDGTKKLHAKLAFAPQVEGLRQWRTLNDRLATRFHAPRMLEWIALPDGVEGALFEHIDGAASTVIPLDIAIQVRDALETLHTDEELRAHLAGPITETCADTFLRTYADRFHADLEALDADRPPFVDAQRLAALRREVDDIIDVVQRSSAFAQPANAPMHGDLWANNILITPTGDWYFLDWDDLSLGDSAQDVAMLLAASSPTLDARGGFARVNRAPNDDAERERLDLYARAIVLDWTIDPLSDWVDAVAAPEHLEQVRDEKHRTHQQSYAWYRARYF